MTSSIKENIRKKIKVGSHYIAALTVFMHAYSSYDNHHIGYAMIYVFFGLLIITVTRMHHQIEKRIYNILPIFNFIEGALCMVSTAHYFAINKKYLPYAYIIVGIAYFVVGAYLYNKTKKGLRTSAGHQ